MEPAVLPSVRISATPSWADRQERHRSFNRVVEFCHPGYEYPHNVLLKLNAIEPEPETPSNVRRFGVHHDTARTACAILANNAWEGYLTADEPTGTRIPIDDPERVLINNRYYFHHPSYPASDPKYPIVADFQSWEFPSQLPSYWHSLVIPPREPLLQPPQCCVVTGRHIPLESAHLVPVNQTFWFNTNSMDRFQQQTGQENINWINQPDNKCLLTKDLHALSGQGYLVFVPRPSLVNYILRPNPFHELVDLYHLRSLEPIQGIPPEYIFAHFAYSIFGTCVFFKDDGWARKCIQLEVEAGRPRYKTRDNPQTDFKKPGRSPTKRRTASYSSPIGKRTRSSSTSRQGVAEWLSFVHEIDSSEEDEPPRGRSLRRHGRVPGLTRSPYSPELDHLALNTSRTVTEEPFPVVVDDDGFGLGAPAGDGRKRSRSHSRPRKRLRRETDA
ncbi:hypothetical protein F5883DRAFT_441084 [Diaporthe sp. PMI_573]|nr:hypothetical protein F5883DRAFT_441084 [Diaporthaceae sp. PMI_573]